MAGVAWRRRGWWVGGWRRFLERAGGGDVLVLTADDAPCDIYNPFLLNMTGSVQPNSVTTACFTARTGSASTTLTALLDGAAGLFITGGEPQPPLFPRQ